jgi:ferredoxin-thioredoxin reductase catalytic subunit
MSKNKQTFNHNPNQSSVDWVIGEILKHQMTYYGTSSMPLRIIEQAKAMHKDEIMDAFDKGCDIGCDIGSNYNYHDGHNQGYDYYNETYGGNK